MVFPFAFIVMTASGFTSALCALRVRTPLRGAIVAFIGSSAQRSNIDFAIATLFHGELAIVNPDRVIDGF